MAVKYRYVKNVEEKYLIREAFKKDIFKAGFRPVAIDEKEHNCML